MHITKANIMSLFLLTKLAALIQRQIHVATTGFPTQHTQQEERTPVVCIFGAWNLLLSAMPSKRVAKFRLFLYYLMFGLRAGDVLRSTNARKGQIKWVLN